MTEKNKTEIIIKLQCPQDHKDCPGRKACTKDRAKGCAQDVMDVWLIEQEDRLAFL